MKIIYFATAVLVFSIITPTEFAIAGKGTACSVSTGGCDAGFTCMSNNVCVITTDLTNCQSGCQNSGTCKADLNGNVSCSVTTPPQSGTIVTLVNPLNVGDCKPDTCLMVFLNKILDFVIEIGAIVVILMLVYVGYMFVVAQGNDTKLTEARRALLWTLIGALILLGAKAISIGIQETVKALSVGQ